MKNQTSIKRTVIGLFALLILISGKLSAQSEILGHTYLGTFNGHAYYMSDCPTTYIDAYLSALEMGGYLATITSQEEDDFLAPFAPAIDCESIFNFFYYGNIYREGGAWIGLGSNDNDGDGIANFTEWHNGEPLGYTNWSEFYQEPTGLYGMSAIIGYIGGTNICINTDYRWYTSDYNTYSSSRYIVEFDQDPGCSQSNKTYVCHNGMTLCINESSLQDHLDHGDYAGPCSPCNSNFVQITNSNAPIVAGHHIDEKEAAYNPNRDVINEDILVYPNPAGKK